MATPQVRYKIFATSKTLAEHVELPEDGTFNLHEDRQQAQADAVEYANKLNAEQFRTATDWQPMIKPFGFGEQI